MNGKYETHKEVLPKYLFKVKFKIEKIEYFKIEHIPKELNQSVDLLSKMENLDGSQSIKLLRPSIKEAVVMDIDDVSIGSWMDPIIIFLKRVSLTLKLRIQGNWRSRQLNMCW